VSSVPARIDVKPRTEEFPAEVWLRGEGVCGRSKKFESGNDNMTNNIDTNGIDLENRPVSFKGESNKKQKMLNATDFRGRVPVVLTFVGPTNPTSDHMIVDLDSSLISFGQRRVQLLVVVEEDPTALSERLDVRVPLMFDRNLTKDLAAQIDEQGRIASVILGNDGMALDVVRQAPTEGQAGAILVAVDRLSEQFPDRFETLPDPFGSQGPEIIGDPTRQLFS
jgi:hypothetical protein